MGARGPVKKRSSERRRRNAEPDPDRVEIAGPVKVPEPSDDWHPIATEWFESLADSGQSQFFEPSDWQAACILAETLSGYLSAPRHSAEMFKGLWSAMGDLLTTEAARRRVRMEVERADGADPAAVTELAEYRKRVGG